MASSKSHLFPKLKQLLNRYHPQWRGPDGAGGESVGDELPLLSALSRLVALDLDEPWWKHWWTRDHTGEGQIVELDRLIINEFYPITDALAQAAGEHLKARQSATLEEANLVYVGLAEILQEQSRARLERTRDLISGGNTLKQTESQRNQDTRAAGLKKQIASMDMLVSRLEKIERVCAEKMG